VSDAAPLKVMTDQLGATAQVVDLAAKRLIDRYQQVAVEVQQLLESKWSGAAADACRAAWDEWSEGFRLTVMGLHDESTAPRLAPQQYSTTDSTASASMGSVAPAR
jgi:WXG100 family type VII secretion target